MTTVTSKSLGVLAAAASAASMPLGDQALAQTPTAPANNGYVSVEGGILFSDFGRTTFPNGAVPYLPGQFPDKVPDGPPLSSFGTHKSPGGYGSFSLGQVKPGADWRFTLSVFKVGTFTGEGNASNTYTGLIDGDESSGAVNVSERHSLNFGTMDFDLGSRFNVHMFQVRAFYGARGILTREWIDQFIGTTGDDKFGTFGSTRENHFRSSFVGFGPRVGVEFQPAGPFGLYGTASASFMAGVRDANYVSLGSSNTGASQRKADWVGNISGTLGVLWNFMPNGSLMLGYRADEWFNIHDTFGFANLPNQSKNVFTHSPVFKVTVQY